MYLTSRNTASRAGSGKSSRCGSKRARSSRTARSTQSAASLRSAVQPTSQRVLCALALGRAKDVGVAYIELSDCGYVHLLQISDGIAFSQTLVGNANAFLNNLNPSEILLPNLANQELANRLEKMFAGSGASIVTVARKFFDDVFGGATLERLAANPVTRDLKKKYLPLSAFSCLIQYAEIHTSSIFADKSLMVVWEEPDGRMMIDPVSAKNLELFRNQRTGSTKKGSLYGLLNHTKTRAGGRKLLSEILSPPIDLETIIARQNALDELFNHEKTYFGATKLLQGFTDLDTLLSQLVVRPKKPDTKTSKSCVRNILSLKHVLSLTPELAATLKPCLSSAVFASIHKALTDPALAAIRQLIDKSVSTESKWHKSAAHMQQELVFAILPGISGELDVERATYKQTMEEIPKLVDQYATEFILPELRIHYGVKRGYILQIAASKVKELPVQAVQAVKKGKSIFFTTDDMHSLNSRLKKSLDAIYVLTSQILEDLKFEFVNFALQ